MPVYAMFQFNYLEYRQFVEPLMREVDQGRFESLYAQVEKVVKNTIPEDWVLQDQGTELFAIEPVEQPDEAQIGYCLLVILSKFVQPIKTLPNPPRTLYAGLKEIHWSERDIERLMFGNHIASILRPDLLPPARDWRDLSTPYWHWVRPDYSMRCGWLTSEELQEIVSRLKQSKELLLSIDPEIVSSYTKLHWPFSSDGLAMLTAEYHEMMIGFQTAISANCGLYTVLS